MINIQPNLIGKLVKIRPIVPGDFEQLSNAASDPKIWQQHPDPRRSQKQYFRTNFFEPALACKGALVFQNLKQDNKLIGSSRYYFYRPKSKDIMIGYTFITRDCWGGSAYNRQIKHLMMSHIYQYVDTIYFSVGDKNIRSQMAMKKIGGKLLTSEQIKERQIPANQSVIFEIHKNDFKGLL